MSDLEALYIFLNSSVTNEMINYLVSTTSSIISVQSESSNYPTPPHSPIDDINGKSTSNNSIPSLFQFINRLIQHSHVQVTTLMSCLVYLERLRQVIPPNSVGMATTHHRIFLGSMLLAAKYTNDSSPMNKHWATYTDGLLTLREVNALELEMIQYIGWSNLRFSNEDLIYSLAYFLDPIKRKLRAKNEANYTRLYSGLSHQSQQLQEQEEQILTMSNSSSLPSLISASSSTSTVSSYMSNIPRKDSIQSIESNYITQTPPTEYILDPNQLSHIPSPEMMKLEQQPGNKTPVTDITLSLRPLRLKPNPNGEKKVLSRRNSSLNLLPLSVPNSKKIPLKVTNNSINHNPVTIIA